MQRLRRLCRYSRGDHQVDPILARPAYQSRLEATCTEDTAHRPQRSEQKKPQLLGEKLRPGATEITETRIHVSVRRMGHCLLRGARSHRHGDLRYTTAETHRPRALFPPLLLGHAECVASVLRRHRSTAWLMNGEWLDCPHHCPIETSEACRNKWIGGPVS